MRVAVIGLGHVGTVTAACLARDGHRVTGVDHEPGRLAAFARGGAPVREPGLDALVRATCADGTLSVTDDAGAAVRNSDATLLCVGTPAGDGRLSLAAVEQAVDTVGAALAGRNSPHVVAIRSTVPPGTTRSMLRPRLAAATGARDDVALAVLPEFFREGHALHDHGAIGFPVLGTDDPAATAPLVALAPGTAPSPRIVPTDTAEAVKLASNAWHALKVGFANEIGRWCAAQGIDGSAVMAVLAADPTLNTGPAYLKPGFAYGGPCLPKDLAALLDDARARAVDLPVLAALPRSNEAVIAAAEARIRASGATRIGLIGLSFKPATGDLRGSPFVDLALRLVHAGITLAIVDPTIDPEQLPAPLLPAFSASVAALAGCELLVVADPVLAGDLDLPTGVPRQHLTHQGGAATR